MPDKRAPGSRYARDKSNYRAFRQFTPATDKRMKPMIVKGPNGIVFELAAVIDKASSSVFMLAPRNGGTPYSWSLRESRATGNWLATTNGGSEGFNDLDVAGFPQDFNRDGGAVAANQEIRGGVANPQIVHAHFA